MYLRLALLSDLTQIKDMYRSMIARMNANHINIWDDIYPCEFFGDDIKNKQLYVLLDSEETLLAAFVLCPSNGGADSVRWEVQHANALYLDRLGVNAARQREGIGQAALREAADMARRLGAEYLRLFVVDDNEPAVRLYEKAGFQKAGGSYDEVIDDDLVLHELGFEIRTSL